MPTSLPSGQPSGEPSAQPLPVEHFDALIEVTRLYAVDGAAQDEFGYAVATDNDIIVVGSLRDDDKGAQSG